MYGQAAKSAGEYDDAKKEYEKLSPSSADFAGREEELWQEMDRTRDDVELFSKLGLGLGIAAGALAIGTVVVLGVELSRKEAPPAVALRPAGAGLALEF
jgi:hypothetical protein